MLEDLQPGKIFHGRYEIVRCIRAGGMGAVYEVVHLETRRHRALKVMLPSIVRDESMRNRFRMEAQITADVESDHIVETFDAGVDTDTGAPFLVMELLRGEDLAHHLRARRRISPEEVVGLLAQLARALEQTHASGIVHRDLKPENLFLAVRGDDPPRLKVLDFGIAKIVAQSSAQGGTTSLGTPLYMAPEQFAGTDVSPRTDLFTVGHIAYTLLAGDSYWSDEAETIGILPLIDRLSRGAVEAPSLRAARRGVTLPTAFDAWFAKSTARLPSDRFERARDQVAALAEALGVALDRATIPTPVTVLGGQPVRRTASPELETAELPTSIHAGSSPRAGSQPNDGRRGAEALAPTSVSADSLGRGAPALTATPSMILSEEPLPPPPGTAQTHHSSVRNVPVASPRAVWPTALAIVAGVALVGAAGFAFVQSRSTPEVREDPAASSATPTPTTPRSEVAASTSPAPPPSTSAALPAPDTAAGAGSPPPPPRVDPAASAPSPWVSASAPPISPKPAGGAATPPPRLPPKKRDPTTVFE
jgi:serine/threonine-protein kinase